MSRLLLLMKTESYKAQAFVAAAARQKVDLTVAAETTQALARLNPAGHLTLDFTHPGRAVRKILAHARRFPVDGVVAADDEGTLLAAEAATALGWSYSTSEAILTARDKLRTRRALEAAGLPTPWHASFAAASGPAEVAARVPYPCVLKPLHLSASRGVVRADDPAAFTAAWHRLRGILAQAGGEEILVESFIPGYEVALEGLLTAGRLEVLAVFDKPDPLDGPFFEETIYTTPSRHDPLDLRRIEAATARAVAALGLTEGPIHAELRVGPETAWILEIAPRSIGGRCGATLRFNVPGSPDLLSLEELILRHALGRDLQGVQREHRAAGVMMIPIPRAGILKGVEGIQEAAAVEGIEDLSVTIARGQEVAPPPEGSRYLGFLFARAEAPEAVETALRHAHRALTIDIEPPATARTMAS